MTDFTQLRAEYPLFIYKDYTIKADENDKIRLTYTFIQKLGCQDFVTFCPSWTLPYNWDVYHNNKNKELLDKTIFFLGCIELISYWKSCCSPQIRIDCGVISVYAEKWLKKLYYNGLGEFFYRNNIHADQNTFLSITSSGKQHQIQTSDMNLTGFLIPIGGGKDSVVTMELLNKYRNHTKCYVINLKGAPIQTALAAGFSDNNIIRFQRHLDMQIVELNKQGFLNGHTPFSAIVAFSSYLCALLEEKKYIVLSNESSANDVYVKGTSVNHQYSKSLEFENDFREFIKNELGSGPEYFSLLRPLNEWNIMKLFVQNPKYLPIFKSCNLGSKQNIWCGKCSKCLFVYIMLSPFIEQNILIHIFGGNLLDDESMIQFFDGLVCDNFDKPFECIGTRAEINTALTYTLQKYEKARKELPLLLQIYKSSYYDPTFDMSTVERFFDKNNYVPDFLKEELGWNY